MKMLPIDALGVLNNPSKIRVGPQTVSELWSDECWSQTTFAAFRDDFRHITDAKHVMYY